MKITSLALVAAMMIPSIAFSTAPEVIKEDRDIAVVEEVMEDDDEERLPNFAR